MRESHRVRVQHEKKSDGGELTMRKSDRVRVQHEKKSDGRELPMRERALG